MKFLRAWPLRIAVNQRGSRDEVSYARTSESNFAFVACEGNDRLLIFDLKSIRSTGSFPVGGDPDVLAYDAELNRLYVAAEQGLV